MKSTYDISKSYDWNYDNGPIYNENRPPILSSQKVKIWDHELHSPIGIPAGPLLNSKYIELYSNLAFDIPIYKTVRTCFRKSHQAPNCLYLQNTKQLKSNEISSKIYTLENEPNSIEEISITNSFGIPSKAVEVWQEDISKANSSMKDGQLMIVSCTGTPMAERGIIDDYVYCAQLAAEAGAKAIEVNYSCPNVTSKEGSIYQDAILSSKISKSIKKVLPHIPLMIKIGYVQSDTELENIINANAKYVDGIAAINTIPMKPVDHNNHQALPGEGRIVSGICGNIVRDIGIELTSRIATIRNKNKFDFIVCGVGGITAPEHFNYYLAAGADIAMSATGAMWNPHLAIDWRKYNAK